jgi:hypothetical protein
VEGPPKAFHSKIVDETGSFGQGKAQLWFMKPVTSDFT